MVLLNMRSILTSAKNNLEKTAYKYTNADCLKFRKIQKLLPD